MDFQYAYGPLCRSIDPVKLRWTGNAPLILLRLCDPIFILFDSRPRSSAGGSKLQTFPKGTTYFTDWSCSFFSPGKKKEDCTFSAAWVVDTCNWLYGGAVIAMSLHHSEEIKRKKKETCDQSSGVFSSLVSSYIFIFFFMFLPSLLVSRKWYMPAILSSLPLLCSGGDSCQGFARLLGNPHTFSLKKKNKLRQSIKASLVFLVASQLLAYYIIFSWEKIGPKRQEFRAVKVVLLLIVEFVYIYSRYK